VWQQPFTWDWRLVLNRNDGRSGFHLLGRSSSRSSFFRMREVCGSPSTNSGTLALDEVEVPSRSPPVSNYPGLRPPARRLAVDLPRALAAPTLWASTNAIKPQRKYGSSLFQCVKGYNPLCGLIDLYLRRSLFGRSSIPFAEPLGLSLPLLTCQAHRYVTDLFFSIGRRISRCFSTRFTS
jgi:hypothetical protein